MSRSVKDAILVLNYITFDSLNGITFYYCENSFTIKITV